MERNVQVKILISSESRLAAVLVQIANKYKSSIYAVYNGKTVNAKSIMGMLSLKIFNGMEFIIKAEGEDAPAALDEMERYLIGEEDID